MYKNYVKASLFLILFFAGNIFCQKTYVIKISNEGFKPDRIKINIGDVVIWQWQEGFHTTTCSKNDNNDEWDAPLNILSPIYTKTFNLSGEYKYYCKLHKKHNGRITVLDPVPVELTQFKAELVNDKIIIIWQTATEVNNMGFDIERKQENEDWSKIDFVAGNGTTSLGHNYHYEDKEIIGNTIYFYRLKQIDLDGTFKYSSEINIRTINHNSVELYQNYPNPFNPVTTIKYNLNGKNFVEIRIFNSLGREIAVLEDEEKAPGNYEIKFDGSNLSSGIYFLKMNAGTYSSVIKMILIH